jgi:hypothetical protein
MADEKKGSHQIQNTQNHHPPEPWLRGTLTDAPPVLRAVLHALELAREDIERYCAGLTVAELHARPFGLAPVAFHLRHIAGSVDRLITYAEGRSLSEQQMADVRSELNATSTKEELFAGLQQACADAESRIRVFDVSMFDEARQVGRKQLPTTVGGLLVHIADHTQRHVGQAVTTAKVVVGQR